MPAASLTLSPAHSHSYGAGPLSVCSRTEGAARNVARPARPTRGTFLRDAPCAPLRPHMSLSLLCAQATVAEADWSLALGSHDGGGWSARNPIDLLPLQISEFVDQVRHAALYHSAQLLHDAIVDHATPHCSALCCFCSTLAMRCLIALPSGGEAG